MAATEIHGMTDEDVVEAPRFEETAGELVATLSGSVVGKGSLSSVETQGTL